jgi:hypothetical protein
MNDHDTIIIYRSRMDAMADEYWWDLFQRHPQWFAWGIGVFVVLVLASIIVIAWPSKPKYPFY